MKKTIPLVVQATPVKEELPVRGREARRAPKSYGTPRGRPYQSFRTLFSCLSRVSGKQEC
jgi:hypothetical protein